MENKHPYPDGPGMRMSDCNEGRIDAFRLRSITYCVDYGKPECSRRCYYAKKQKCLEERSKRK